MDSHEVSTLWTIVVAIVAAAMSWGGAKHAIGSLKQDSCDNKKNIKLLQEELKNFVGAKFCRIERQDCKESRKETSDMVLKKFDELMDRIDLQDQKRHDHANRVQINYVELFNKITSLETIIQERSQRFRKDDGR